MRDPRSTPANVTQTPDIFAFGLDAALVRFDTTMSDRANRAALAFAAHLRDTSSPFHEVSSTLASVTVRFDPLKTPFEEVETLLREALRSRDWGASALPAARKLWRVPTIYGGEFGPQLTEAADLVGMSVTAAIDALSTSRVRVLTIGFAPGLPYLGSLPPEWDIPRQTTLTPRVPAGALVVAIRQFVLFANASPTGWRWIAQTAVPLFDATRSPASLFSPGDEVEFHALPADRFTEVATTPNGGATWEAAE